MDQVASQGYCFQVDLAWRTVVVEALWRVTVRGLASRVARLTGRRG